MPLNSLSRYLSFRSRNGSIIQWNSVSSDAFQSSDELIGVYLTRRYLRRLLNPSVIPEIIRCLNSLDPAVRAFELKEPETLMAAAWSGLVTNRYKIDLGALSLFDALPEKKFTQNERAFVLEDLIEFLKSLCKGNQISFSHQEVFFVPKGQTPPPIFRPGVDIICDSLDEYKKAISSFSYQAAKAILNQLAPDETNDLHRLIANEYSEAKAWAFDDNPALKDIRYFNQAFNADYHISTAAHHGDYARLAFGPAVSIESVLPILGKIRTTEKEITLIFHGVQYDDPSVRKKIREDLLDLVKQERLTYLMHVVLLTTTEGSLTLSDLKPNLSVEQDGYSPLSHGMGYYLSDPELLSCTFRHLQARNPSVGKAWLDEANAPSSPTRQVVFNRGYITSPDPMGHVRASKHASKAQLKARVALSLVQEVNQVIQETQVVSEEQSLSLHQELIQTRQHVLQQRQNVSRDWASEFFNTKFAEFCKELEKEAMRRLSKDDRIGVPSIYITERYRRAKHLFYTQLLQDPMFRAKLAARIFGTGYTMQGDSLMPIYLKDYSVHSIDKASVHMFVREIDQLMDGFYDNERLCDTSILTGRRVLSAYRNHRGTNATVSGPIYEVNLTQLYYSPQALHPSVDPTHHWQSHLNEVVLFPPMVLDSVDLPQKAELIQSAKNLLDLFQENGSLSIEQVKNLEVQFMALNQFYFKEKTEYLRVLTQFMTLFEPPSADYLKIMLQLWINGHQGKMADFLELLLYLESKQLLGYFYTTYFKYANHVLSVFNFLRPQEVALYRKGELRGIARALDTQHQTNNTFLKLAKLPKQSDEQTFGLHVLLYFAQNGRSLQDISYETIDQWWQKTTLKLIDYTHDQTEALRLMHELVNQLVSPDGLHLSPLYDPIHFFKSLSSVLDHAIKHHTVHEQIQAIQLLALMDADFAFTYNDYQIVSAEMELEPGTIDPVTKSYAVSRDELASELFHHTPSSPFLKRAVFRYLGGQTLREDLALYQTLYANLVLKESDQSQVALSEWLMGTMVLLTTGENYRPNLDEGELTQAAFDWGRRNGLTTEKISAELQRFWMAYQQLERDELKGRMTLFGLTPDYWHGKKSIPAVFLQKFSDKQLMRFLFLHREEIIASKVYDVPHLSEMLLQRMIEDHYVANDIKASKKMALLLIKARYPTLTLQELMTDLPRLQVLIEQYGHLHKSYTGAQIYNAFQQLIQVTPNWDACLICLDLLNDLMLPGYPVPIALSLLLLNEVTNRPNVCQKLSLAKPLLGKILPLLSKDKSQVVQLTWLFDVTERLLSFESVVAAHLLDALLQQIKTPEGCEFFKAQCQLLTDDALRHLLTLVDKYPIPIDFIAQLCNEKCNFWELESFFDQCDKAKIKSMLVLAHSLSNIPPNAVMRLQQLHRLSLDDLSKLANLVSIKAMPAENLVEVIGSAHLSTNIAAYERALYAQNQARFTVDVPRLKGLIAKIRCHSGEDEGWALDKAMQTQLLDDYRNMMSYMTINPVLIEKDAQGLVTELTLHQLNDLQFKALFKHIQHQINTSPTPHEYELVLLAMSCEAMYRSHLPFPRDTQILVALNALRQTGHLMHGVKTGGGKSVITAFDAVRQCARHQTVELSTENNKLAFDHIQKFAGFYAYLGIDCAKNVLEASSTRREYLDQGINCATPGSFDLFHKQMLLEGESLPLKRAILLDEGDAALGSTVQFRLAASINPILKDAASWECLYHYVLDFIEEEQIFIQNPCAPIYDVTNLKQYCAMKNATESFARFMGAIPDDLLDELIESAKVTDALEEDINFRILPKTKAKKAYYAAPILENTKRPDLKVSYAGAVQQLLHVKIKRQYKERFPIALDPISETLIVSSIKNYLDECRMQGGTICLYTATPGSNVEVKEYRDSHDITVFKYPSFFEDDLAVNMGLHMANDVAHQRCLIHEKLQQHQVTHPDQPCLLITDSPLEAIELSHYLKSQSVANIETYLGDDQEGELEEEVINNAGKKGIITVTTESLARGADFKTEHPNGMFLINACTHLTEASLIQILGRVARNGHPGDYLTLFNREKLLVPVLEDVNETFKANQKFISLKELQERLKTRLLEEARDHVMTHYLLGLHNKADKILISQQGHGASLVDKQQLYIALRDLNDQFETRFSNLLGDRFELDPVEKACFLEEIVALYQSKLNAWMTDDTFEQFTVVLPPVPLDSMRSLPVLNQLTVHDLSIVSAILSIGWEHVGHQGMQKFWFNVDHLLLQFDPYFKGQCTLKVAIGETLKKTTLLDFKNLVGLVGEARLQSDAFVDLLKNIPILGPWLPLQSTKEAIVSYFETLAQHIKDEAWDKIALPQLSQTLNGWYDRLVIAQQLGGAFATVSAGPVVFVINYIIIPTLGSWIKNLLKVIFRNSESKYAQMLLGLDEFLSDARVAFTFLSSVKSPLALKVGDILDKIVPLLKNKVFITALTYFLEKQGMNELVVFIEALPIWLDILQSKRDLTLEELQRADQVIALLMQGCQLDVVKQQLSHTPIEGCIQKLSELGPDFYSHFKQLSLQDLARFLKLFAHPKFRDFLNQLPGKATFLDLNLWLNTVSETDIPMDVIAAVKTLNAYQSNRESLAGESKQTLMSLKQEFNLTSEDMAQYLDRLHPNTVKEVQESVSPSHPVSTIPWTKIIGYSLLIFSLIAINIALMSMPALITSGLIVGYLAYPYVKDAVVTHFFTQVEGVRPTEKVEAIPFKAITPMQIVVPSATESLPMKPPMTHSLSALSATFGIYKTSLDLGVEQADMKRASCLPVRKI